MKKEPVTGENEPNTNPAAQRAAQAAIAPQPKGEINGRPKAAAKKPTPLQITQMAIALRAAPQNRHKSNFELVQQVWDLWDATNEFADAKTEKRIILATAARMTDEEDLLKIPKGKRKLTPKIITSIWFERMRNYPGDKYNLLLDLLCTLVPRKILLAELFRDAHVSDGEAELKELLRFGLNHPAPEFVHGVASYLTVSRAKAERQLLQSAIKTGHARDIERWCDKVSQGETRMPVYFEARLRYFFEDLNSIREVQQYHLGRSEVPVILCRWLIHVWQARNSERHSHPAQKKKPMFVV